MTYLTWKRLTQVSFFLTTTVVYCVLAYQVPVLNDSVLLQWGIVAVSMAVGVVVAFLVYLAYDRSRVACIRRHPSFRGGF
jgi:hypothetical protein